MWIFRCYCCCIVVFVVVSIVVIVVVGCLLGLKLSGGLFLDVKLLVEEVIV